MARQNIATFTIDGVTCNGIQISDSLISVLMKTTYTIKNYDPTQSPEILSWGTLIQKSYEAQSMYNKAINGSSVLRLNMGEEIYEGGADVRKLAVQYSENGVVVINAYQTLAVRVWGNHDMYLGFVVDDVTGDLWILWGDRQDPYNSLMAYYYENLDVVNILTPVSYNWQSVPSISGKNGILSLVTLDSESINDGEPVSGAAVSVFDQAPSNDNNIKNLADTYGGGEASSAVDVTVKYKVTLPPGGIFDVLKLVAKKGSEPEDVTDGDKIVNISANKTKKTVTGLDENSMYYFKIFAEDSNGSTSESNEKHITTSGDEGWSFDYTGQIQTFTAPKTGIYSLETWGAQGGDATDGTLTARGGYGAYAYGEVLLQQGETIYINIGGQNGYGGGGKLDPVPEQYSFIKKVNDIYTRDESNGNNYRFLDFTYFKYRYNGTWGEYPIALDKDDLTYISFQDNFNLLHDDTNSVVYMYYWISDMVTISLANDGSGGYDATYSGINVYTRAEYMGSSDFGTGTQMKFNTDNGNPYGTTYTFEYTPQTQAHFSSLSDALNYVYLHYANINLYVDGVLWVEPE